jgi:hypothetical protein
VIGVGYAQFGARGFVVESAFMSWEKDVADRGRFIWYTV